MRLYFKQHRAQLLTCTILVIACAFGVIDPQSASLAGMALVVAPFPVTAELTAVSLAYRNRALIADEVLPRVPVSLQSFKYLTWPKGSFFTIPETKVGRKGRPNTVELEGSETESSTQDHALDDEIPVADIMNAAGQPGMPNPLMRAAEGLTDLIALAREKRVADLIFAAANYASGNKVQLAGNDQWSSTHDDANPLVDITTGLDAMVMRANIMVMGQAVSTKLRQNKYIVKAYNGTSGDSGMVPLAFLKELFELEDIYVGQGFVNTARKGQTASLARVWGKHCALLHRNKNADTRGGTTFGFSAQWGTRVSGSQTDANIGMRGGERVRVGESIKELMIANDLGYFIEDAVA